MGVLAVNTLRTTVVGAHQAPRFTDDRESGEHRERVCAGCETEGISPTERRRDESREESGGEGASETTWSWLE